MTVISEVWDKASVWVNSRCDTVRDTDETDLISSHLGFSLFLTLSRVHASLKGRSVSLARVSLKIDDSSCPSHVQRTFIKSQSESNYGSYRSQLKLFAFKSYCRLKYFQSPRRFIIALSESGDGKWSLACWGFEIHTSCFPWSLFTINSESMEMSKNPLILQLETDSTASDFINKSVQTNWCLKFWCVVMNRDVTIKEIIDIRKTERTDCSSERVLDVSPLLYTLVSEFHTSECVNIFLYISILQKHQYFTHFSSDWSL